MYKRGSYRHTWHPTTLRAFGVAPMRRGGRLDVQEHTRNAPQLQFGIKWSALGGSETAEAPNW